MYKMKKDMSLIEVDYCGFAYKIWVTNQYYDTIRDFLNHHFYISSMKTDADCVDFDYTFYYIINTTAYESIFNSLQRFESNDIKVFKDEICSVIQLNDVCYFVSKQDNYIAYRKNNDVFVIVRSDCLYDYQLLRIIREFIYRVEQDNGKVFIHAAACCLDDRGFLIIGNKGAGKTTLLCYFLEYGLDFLANDRVFLKFEHDRVSIQGFPIPLRVAYESLSKLNNKIDPKGFFRHQVNSEKAIVTPKELSYALGVSVCDAAYMAGIIIPQIQINKKGVNIETISADSVASLFKQNCYTPFDESRRTEWIVRSETRLCVQHENANRMLELFRSIPIYRVTYGTQESPNGVISTFFETIDKR